MIKDLFLEGQAALKLKAKEAESTKSGVLRGGSGGMLFPNGTHTGTCLAQAYLRFSGIDGKSLERASEPDLGGRELMFEAGRVNEDSWYSTLMASSWVTNGGLILREEEIPIAWTTENGIAVTGRPDIVLCNADKSPVRGIELKLVSSIWTARTVLINKTPKTPHLIQAGHYMLKLGVPFELWYTSRTDFETSSDFHLNSYPAYGEPGSELFTYRFYRVTAQKVSGDFKKTSIDQVEYKRLLEDGEHVMAMPAKYMPFVQGFILEFSPDGSLTYKDATDPKSEPKATVITRDGIAAYYEELSRLKTVPKEPIAIKPDGKKDNFRLSSYCTLGEACCKNCAGMPVNEWKEKVLRDNKILDKTKVSASIADKG